MKGGLDFELNKGKVMQSNEEKPYFRVLWINGVKT